MASLSTEITIKLSDESKRLIRQFVKKVEWIQERNDSCTLKQPDNQTISDCVLREMPQNGVGKRIKLMREFACLTEKELSERTKISKALLTKYEAGERKPNAKTLGKIANALKIDICVLMEDWK